MSRLMSAVLRYAEDGFARFHMPGHKGGELPYPGFGQIAALDLTEAAGLDSLYNASGVIRQTELAYARLYGSADCLISAGGSTLCIQAMLALAAKPGQKLLVGREAHVAVVNAMALLDLHPQWLMPARDCASGLAAAITPQQVEQGLCDHPDAAAVYLTSPTYFGVCADIETIARVCKTRGVPLLVDNAHGAHLAFFSPNRHPIALGAALCCDSLHKTLPVLTGGALLHIGDGRCAPHARQKLSLFGSTSPSYLIMASIDGALDYLASGAAAVQMQAAAERLAQVGQKAKSRGYLLAGGDDPLRLTLGAAGLGYTGEQLGEHLRSHKVEPEYAGGGFVVLMASPFNPPEDFVRLESALENLPTRPAIPLPVDDAALPVRVLSLRDAALAESEIIPIENTPGRIACALVAPCPPGIALACAGERIDERLARALKNYGISRASVVK